MVFDSRRYLDPLDLEFLERAFESLRETSYGKNASSELDSDEGLEAALRRELIEIARSNGVTDTSALQDDLFADPADQLKLETAFSSADESRWTANKRNGRELAMSPAGYPVQEQDRESLLQHYRRFHVKKADKA
jgi:hypothetical protein